MGWTIILQDEDHEQISILEEESILEKPVDLNSFRLVKYLDPYGDTIFNNVQMDDLIIDLEELIKVGEDKTIIDEIIILANRCKKEIHTYLAFYGD